jgi:hypothetical protein
MCGDPFGSHLPTKETFGLQKYQLQYLYANVSKGTFLQDSFTHVLRNQNAKPTPATAAKQMFGKRHIPCLLHLCSSQLFRLQPPSFSGYNLREAPTPQFSGYNQKEATTPYVLRLQPEGGYNHLSLPRPTTLKYK